MSAGLNLGFDITTWNLINFVGILVAQLLEKHVALLVALRLLVLEVVLDVIGLKCGDEHFFDAIGAVGSIEKFNPCRALAILVITVVVLHHHLVDAHVHSSLCHCRECCNHSNQCQYYFLIHFEMSLNRNYNGMLPCFLAGLLYFLVRSCSRARITRKRVLRGSITSSM